jgi:hypothetical protein
VDSLVERGDVARVFRGAADVRAQGFEQIAIRYDTFELSVIVDDEQVMEFKGVENFLDDIEPIIHLDRDNSCRHDVAYIHDAIYHCAAAKWKTLPPF